MDLFENEEGTQRESRVPERTRLARPLGKRHERVVRDGRLELLDRDEERVRAGAAPTAEADIHDIAFRDRRQDEMTTIGHDVLRRMEHHLAVHDLIFRRGGTRERVPFVLGEPLLARAAVEVEAPAQRTREALGHVRRAADASFVAHEPVRVVEAARTETMRLPESIVCTRSSEMTPRKRRAVVRRDDLGDRREAALGQHLGRRTTEKEPVSRRKKDPVLRIERHETPRSPQM